jgi:hypothetical protein
VPLYLGDEFALVLRAGLEPAVAMKHLVHVSSQRRQAVIARSRQVAGLRAARDDSRGDHGADVFHLALRLEGHDGAGTVLYEPQIAREEVDATGARVAGARITPR